MTHTYDTSNRKPSELPKAIITQLLPSPESPVNSIHSSAASMQDDTIIVKRKKRPLIPCVFIRKAKNLPCDFESSLCAVGLRSSGEFPTIISDSLYQPVETSSSTYQNYKQAFAVFIKNHSEEIFHELVFLKLVRAGLIAEWSNMDIERSFREELAFDVAILRIRGSLLEEEGLFDNHNPAETDRIKIALIVL